MRFALSVVGVGVAVLLVLMMSGVFVGTTRQVTTYIDHSRNAVWVMQPGVSQMFKSVSWLPDDDKAALMAVPEIASAEPILGLAVGLRPQRHPHRLLRRRALTRAPA